MEQQGRLLDLLYKAYEMPADLSAFDDLMDAAKSYLFTLENDWVLAPDLPRHAKTDPHLGRHLTRLSSLLQQTPVPASVSDGIRDRLQRLSYGQFVVTADGMVPFGNPAARAALGVDLPCSLDTLPFDPDSLRHVRAALKDLRRDDGPMPDTGAVHLFEAVNERPCIGVMKPVMLPAADTAPSQPALLVSLTHIVWSQHIQDFVGAAMNLTEAESAILAELVHGAQVKGIAERRGRSLDTVKNQLKSILRKSGCERQADLVRLAVSVAYLADDTGMTLQSVPAQAVVPKPGSADTPWQRLDRDGRTISYARVGADHGRPVLYFHGLLQGPCFLPEFVDGLAAAGLTLYAPSRPGFGNTSPAGDYRQDVVDDAIALVDAVASDSVLLMAHMGGACHAFRALARLGNRARGVLVVSGGIPIDETAHFEKMNRYTRIAAAAAKHAPSVMEMIGHVGAAYVKARGHRAYLTRFYEKAAVDLALLDDPLRSRVLFDGLDHLISQGIRAFIHDGQAIMSDWNADLDEAKTPSHWLHGALDPVVAAQHVRRRLADVPSCRLDIVEGTGQGLLHQAPDRVLSALTALSDRA